MSTNTSLFSDFNTLVGLNSKQAIVVNDDAVANVVLNIVLIQKRSRKFRTTYGAASHFFLQKQVTAENAEQYRMTLYQDLTKWAGQVAKFDMAGIQVRPLPNYDGYGVVIVYKSNLSGYYNQVSIQLPSTTVAR